MRVDGSMYRTALLSALMFVAAGLAHAVQDCEVGGQNVNPANGSTTAGKTGLMRCKDRDSGEQRAPAEPAKGEAKVAE